MELKIVTGMSGAGKSNLVQVLEDLGYYCVDNLPPNLFVKFVELILQAQPELSKAALVVDVRGGKFFLDVHDVLQELKHKGIGYEIIFLEASDDILVRRFKETRRRHPLAYGGSIWEGIQEERRRLQTLRGQADIIIDTSDLRVQSFKDMVAELLDADPAAGLQVSVSSFGFKYGLPIDADLVMDVRFLPNPYYIPELKPLCGLDAPVRDYVLGQEEAASFAAKYADLLLELLPQYKREGKHHLSVAIGCTGGQHRSVALAEDIGQRLREGQRLARIKTSHRDLRKNRYHIIND